MAYLKTSLKRIMQRNCLPEQNYYLFKELKLSVRSLDLLKKFKANELKFHLLYILPVVLPFSGGEVNLSDKEDFRNIVCLRCMYESSNHKVFGKTIKPFCVSKSHKRKTSWNGKSKMDTSSAYTLQC